MDSELSPSLIYLFACLFVCLSKCFIQKQCPTNRLPLSLIELLLFNSPHPLSKLHPRYTLGSNQNDLNVNAIVFEPRFSLEAAGKMFNKQDQKEES